MNLLSPWIEALVPYASWLWLGLMGLSLLAIWLSSTPQSLKRNKRKS
jgi:hypothetical protein